MPRTAVQYPGVDFYALLEVSPRASAEVINAAFRVIMRARHPDAGASDGKTVRMLNEAHDTLCDVQRRAAYDATRTNQIGVGKVIGEYRMLDLIAEGGIGKTYKGEHILTGMPVCIKHCTEIDPVHEQILLEETRAMWDLRHYALPAARSLTKLDDDRLALVMSYIPGPTLQQIVDKVGNLDPEHVAWIMERVLNALSYIHRHGVIHGDIKPQNIIVQPDRHMAVLIDFGLAMVKPTRDSTAKGYTQFFAPPEQEFESGSLRPETDFYSLGMTMIHALCGGQETPFLNKQVPRSTPAPLKEFLHVMVARDPASRPNWKKGDLCEQMKDVRARSFQRTASGMKPIPGF